MTTTQKPATTANTPATLSTPKPYTLPPLGNLFDYNFSPHIPKPAALAFVRKQVVFLLEIFQSDILFFNLQPNELALCKSFQT